MAIDSMYLKSFFTHTQSPMAIVGANFQLREVNAAFLKEWRADKSSIVGKYCWEVFQQKKHICTKDGEFCPLQAAMAQGKPISGRKTFPVDHHLFDAHLETIPIQSADGKMEGAIQRFSSLKATKFSSTPRFDLDYLSFLSKIVEEFQKIQDVVKANRYFISLIQSQFHPDFMAQLDISNKKVVLHIPNKNSREISRDEIFSTHFDPESFTEKSMGFFDVKESALKQIFSPHFISQLETQHIDQLFLTSANQSYEHFYIGIYGWQKENKLSANEEIFFRTILKIFRVQLHLYSSWQVHKQKNTLAQILSATDSKLIEGRNIESIVQAVADVLFENFPGLYRFSFLLPGEKKNHWKVHLVRTRNQEDTLFAGQEFDGTQIKTPPEIQITNATDDNLKELNLIEQKLYSTGVRSFIHIPLIWENRVLGFLKLGLKVPIFHREIYFDFLHALGNHIALAIFQNQKSTEYHHQQELWRHIFDSVQMGITVHDKNWTVQLANRTVMKLLGGTESDILGKKCYRLFHKTDHPIDECPYLKILQSKKEEFAIMDVFGDGRKFHVACYPRFDHHGEIMGYIHIVREVTQELQVQQQLLQQEKLATMGEIIAGVAHELNNPLTGVIGFSELLMEEPGVPQPIRDDLQTIHDEAERAKRIVQNLLFFARQVPQENEVIPIHQAIEKALALIEYDVKSKGIQIKRRFAHRELSVRGDYFQFQEVILNLVTNAAQAIELGGKGDQIVIETQKNKSRAVILISDNGPGISAENLKKIFDPFFTTKPVGQGTGMGLSIVYGIIQNHKGNITVSSKPGEGATFTVRLPLYETKKGLAGVPEAAEAESEPLQGKTIMILDDEEMIRQLLKQIFTQSGNEVLIPANAHEALEALESVSPDIILSDVRMPDMNGFQFFNKAVTRNPELSSRFIMITGDVLSKETEKFLNDNKLASITKPFDLEELKKMIATIAEQNQNKASDF